MKKRTVLRFAGAAFALCFGFLAKVPAYAGDINAAEQMIIDFYNGTFSYEGKTYVATEEAKASVYAKLMEDGVDLTDQEARTAIRQASAKVGEGVEQGYLTEVSSDDSGQGNEAGETETGAGSDTRGETGKEQGSDGTGGERETEGNGDGGNTGDGEEAGSGKNTGNGAENGLEQAGSGESSEMGDDFGSEAPKPFLKMDLAQLLEETEKEGESYVQISPGESFTITAEQYLQGKVTAVSSDGYVLFEGGLPLKNTGYKTGNWELAAAVMTAVFCIVLGAAAWLLYLDRKQGTDVCRKKKDCQGRRKE